MLKEALKKAKREEEKKVSINFQVPFSLKESFDALCRSNEVSLTAMLNSLMEVSIEESQGLGDNDCLYAKKLLEEVEQYMRTNILTEEELDLEVSSLHGAPDDVVQNFIKKTEKESKLYNEISTFLNKE